MKKYYVNNRQVTRDTFIVFIRIREIYDLSYLKTQGFYMEVNLKGLGEELDRLYEEVPEELRDTGKPKLRTGF